MKKRILSMVLSICMLASLLVALPITASAKTSGTCGDKLTWTLDNGTLTISGTGEMEDYNSWSYAPWYNIRSNIMNVVIEKGVTSIGENAFYDYKSLTSITIPDSVTSIGSYAFNHCESLTNIKVNEKNDYYSSVEGVLHNKDKTELIMYPLGNVRTEYEILDSVISIGSYAFNGCKCLTSVTMPDSVTRIGDRTFFECSGLANVTVSEDNNYYSSIDGVLYNKDKTDLIQYPVGNERTEFEIPNGVTYIYNYAFYNCENLTNVEISDSVKYIGDYVFWSCGSLTSIMIPDSVTKIGSYAFEYCDALTDVYYTGAEEEWDNIRMGIHNKALLNATIHYNYIKMLPTTTAAITKTETDEEYTFEVNAADKHANCYVYATTYDENGALLGVNKVALDTEDNTTISIGKNDNAQKAKVFIFSKYLQPIIDAKVFEIE